MSQQNKIRSSLLCGNIQGTVVIGEAWDRLTEKEKIKLQMQLQDILDHSKTIVEDIVSSIEAHKDLGLAWRNLGDDVRASRINTFTCIALNDLTHPDGTVSAQRKTKQEGEQQDARGNRR
jgi:hypothetical protein